MTILLLDSTIDKPSEELIKRQLRKHFDFDISNRIKVVYDVVKFNYKEDKSVWDQAKGRAPHYGEVYWDNTWICDISLHEKPSTIDYKFLVGFKNAYESGQIGLLEPMEYIPDTTLEDAIKDVRKRKATTPEDAVVNETVLSILEDKKEVKDNAKKKLITT